MKYKSLYCLLLAYALTCGIGAVSSVSANTALSSLQPTDTQAATLRQTRDSIRLGLLLLGEDNLHAGRNVQGGTENYAADGTTLIGRIYSLPPLWRKHSGRNAVRQRRKSQHCNHTARFP